MISLCNIDELEGLNFLNEINYNHYSRFGMILDGECNNTENLLNYVRKTTLLGYFLFNI